MSTGENENNVPAAETTAPAEVPAKKPKPKKTVKAKAKPAKAAVKKTAKKVAKPAAKKTAKKADKKTAKKVSQRGKGPANLRKELHAMLLKKLPEKYRFDKNSLDFDKIAADQKMTIEGVYKWFRHDKVTPGGVMTFVKMGGGKLKLADFHPFVFKK